MIRSAIRSRSAVVTPGRTASATCSTVRAVTRPATRIRSISSGDLKMITRGLPAPLPGPSAGDVGKQPRGPGGHLVLGAHGVDLQQLPPLRVERQERLGAPVVDLQAVADRHL